MNTESDPIPLQTGQKSDLQMAFQPIWDCRLGEVFAFEALARGQNGETAQELIERLRPDERYAFDQCCRVAAIRDAVAAGFLRSTTLLSINFFPDVSEDPFAETKRTVEVAKHYGLPPERIMFEFGEGDRVDAYRMAETIEAHRKFGIQTVFDDFGSGNSGLQMLSRFTPEAIKLDPTLVNGLARSWSRRLTVEKVISIARMRNIRLIAEGVERQDDFEKLLGLGVRYFQGYHIARPQIGRLERPQMRPAA